MKASNFLTLGQADNAYKKSKSTISKDLKSVKLSYKEKNNSGYKIDISELDKVYGSRNTQETPVSNDTERLRTPKEYPENEILRTKLEAKGAMIERLQAEIEDLRQQRDEWKNQASAQTRLLEHQSKKKNWFTFGKNNKI